MSHHLSNKIRAVINFRRKWYSKLGAKSTYYWVTVPSTQTRKDIDRQISSKNELWMMRIGRHNNTYEVQVMALLRTILLLLHLFLFLLLLLLLLQATTWNGVSKWGVILEGVGNEQGLLWASCHPHPSTAVNWTHDGRGRWLIDRDINGHPPFRSSLLVESHFMGTSHFTSRHEVISSSSKHLPSHIWRIKRKIF